MKKWAIVVLVAVIGILATVWLLTRPTPEREVRRRFRILSEVVGKSPGESNSLMALKMERLGRLMADPVDIETDRFAMGGTYTPEELASLAMRVRGMMKEVKLAFPDLTIEALTERDARVSSTVRFVMREGDSGQEETAEVNVVLVKVDGAWRFRSFSEVQVLQR